MENDRSAALERLQPFVGEWRLRVGFDTSLEVTTVFEWALGGQFLIQRTEVPHPDAPDSMIVVSPDHEGDGYTQHYFDSRGVVRLYAMTFRDGLWTLHREKPDFTPLAFSQRFTGRFGEDGRTIQGRAETSHDGGQTWELDFEIAYTKVD
jgi:hypothetical protein